MTIRAFIGDNSARVAMDLRFAFVCQRQWKELVGTDPIFRFCPDCSRDIVNLDPMSESARETFFRDAQRTGITPCVFATVRNPNFSSCQDALEEESIEEFVQLGGEPVSNDEFIFDDDDTDIDEMLKETT